MVNTKKSKNKKILAVCLVIAVGLVAGVFLYKKNKDNQPVVDTSSKTTSTAPTAQSDFTGGNDRDPGNTDGEDDGSGIVEDANGDISNTPSRSGWTTSKSGEVTVYGPVSNGSLKSGDMLTGKTSAKTVNFRLIDDISGVISEGQLNVVSGKFSGKFNFKTRADQGRLDVFLTKSDGTEYGNVELTVRFQ